MLDKALNSDIEQFLVKLSTKKSVDITKFSINTLRENYEKFALANGGPLISVARIEDLKIPIDKDYHIPIRIYTPVVNSKLPVVIYFHGGSWHFGNHTTHDVICRHLAILGNSIVIAVDWRLAPEYKFPAPIEDCLNVYNWVIDNADIINAQREKIIFAGDSAGANVIVASLIRLRNNQATMPYAQFLIYPALDLNFNSKSIKQYSQGYFINISDSIFFAKNYAGNTDVNHPEISPLKAQDFRDLPKAVIISAEFDPFIDDSRDYSKKLLLANVEVMHKIYPGMIHDFLHLIYPVPEIKNIFEEIATHLRNI